MFKISKEFHFDMAHLLNGHDGKCQNLHGHTYKLQVELCSDLIPSGAKKGMVADFSDVKSAVKKWILEPMDHAFMFDQSSEKECQIAELLTTLESKTFAFPTRTTAENIAQFIFQRLRANTRLPISCVRLWETPTAFCEYSE